MLLLLDGSRTHFSCMLKTLVELLSRELRLALLCFKALLDGVRGRGTGGLNVDDK